MVSINVNVTIRAGSFTSIPNSGHHQSNQIALIISGTVRPTISVSLTEQCFYISQQFSALCHFQGLLGLCAILREWGTHPFTFHSLHHRLHRVHFYPGFFIDISYCSRALRLSCTQLIVDVICHAFRHSSTLPLAHAISEYNHQYRAPTFHRARLLGGHLRLRVVRRR
jgi:hypothetical protein